MALVDTKDLLLHAYRNRYAVGAFEVVSLDFLKAVIKAAEDSRSPVILNVNDRKGKIKNLELLMAGVERAARISSVPVAINFDHCATNEDIINGIRLGCNCVMLDASEESFPENVDKTKDAVTLAHSCGVPVEGSLGHVSSVVKDIDKNMGAEPVLTPILEAPVYVERTAVDFLAVSIGTTHGRTQNKNKLDYGRLAKINNAAKIPLVIHGGTGLSDNQYHRIIDNGVAKINYFTALTEQAMRTIKNSVESDHMGYLELFELVRESIYKEVKRCMQVWRSAGRAAEVLLQCNIWHNLEHVVSYNSGTQDEKHIQQIVLQGKQELSEIPGVLNVNIGKSTNENGEFEYCWIIRMANKLVIDTLKKNPIYSTSSKNIFQATAAGKPGINYEMLNEVELEPSLRIITQN